MEISDELRIWVKSLTIAEKRFVTLLGKSRSGASASQHLELFEWLNLAGEQDEIPEDAKFRQNLPTVSNRLKGLILDSLSLLHKGHSTDSAILVMLNEAGLLQKKKLYVSAHRHLRKVKKMAYDFCRYASVLQCIELEIKNAVNLSPADVNDSLEKLHQEEMTALDKLSRLRKLQYHHDQMLATVRKHSFHRDAKILPHIMQLAADEIVQPFLEGNEYLEKALAVNLAGLRDLYERKPDKALVRYRNLLAEWEKQPSWQKDQPDLLLLICKFYQTAVLYSPVPFENLEQDIVRASAFTGLSPDTSRDFQRLLFHNEFAITLNSGNMEAVGKLIADIKVWLGKHNAWLTEAQVLPFLCNIAVAEFLNGDYDAANKTVNQILNLPNKQVRKDIRDFAIVLQIVLQFELGNENLNEYLTRSGKRYFEKKQSTEINFELAVVSFIEGQLKKTSSANQVKSSDELIGKLDALAARDTGGIPLLGLNEIRMWAESRKRNVPLVSVFLETVHRNLEALRGQPK